MKNKNHNYGLCTWPCLLAWHILTTSILSFRLLISNGTHLQHSVVKSNVNANKVLQSFIYAYCTIKYTSTFLFSSPYASKNYKYICISAPVKCVTLFIASTTAVRDSGDLVCIKGPWHFSDLGQFCALPYCHIHTCSRLQVCVLGHAQSLSPFMVIWSCLPPRSHSPSPVQYRKYTHRLQWKPMRGCLR